MTGNEESQQACAEDCYQYIKDNLNNWLTDLDDFDKAIIVKALINELNNDLVAYLCRIEFKKRGIEP